MFSYEIHQNKILFWFPFSISNEKEKLTMKLIQDRIRKLEDKIDAMDKVRDI